MVIIILPITNINLEMRRRFKNLQNNIERYKKYYDIDPEEGSKFFENKFQCCRTLWNKDPRDEVKFY